MLQQSIDHLIKGSGLLPTLWKVQQIWGGNTAKELIDYLYKQYYEEFEPNDDHISWLNKYKSLYQIEGKPWEG